MFPAMTTRPSPLCSLSRACTSSRSPFATLHYFTPPRITKTFHIIGSRACGTISHAPNRLSCSIGKSLGTSFLSPFTPSLGTCKSSSRQSPAMVLTSAKRDGRPKRLTKRRVYSDNIKLTPPTASLIIGAAVMAVFIAATSGVVVAGAVTTLVSVPIVLAIGAAVIPLFAVSSVALAPLMPLLGAFGLFSVASGNFVGMLFDKVLCTVLCINFLGAAFSAYRRVRNRDRQLADESDADLDPLGIGFESESDTPIRQSAGSRYLSLIPSFVSVIPQINGLGWFLTLSDAWDFLPLPRRATLVKNAVLYSIPGFFWAIKGVFLSGFNVFSKTPTLGGSAWWVALLLGAIHLQFERSKLEEEAQAAEETLEEKSSVGDGRGGGGKRKGLKKRKITAVERQSLEWTRELEEFDALLGKKPSASLPESPRDWSSGDVVKWLQQQGLARYGASFLEHDVDGEILMNLTGEELRKDLGVTSLGDRKRMGVAIQDLEDLRN